MVQLIALLGINLITLASPQEANIPSDREQKMIDEINYVRTNPKDYIQYIDTYTEYWGNVPSEVKAGKELKRELNSMTPLDSLHFSQEIYDQCLAHANWMKRTGKFRHSDYDFAENLVSGDEEVRMAILSLLIDDGIPSRGHRKNLLDPEFTKVACVEVDGMVNGIDFVFVQGFDY